MNTFLKSHIQRMQMVLVALVVIIGLSATLRTGVAKAAIGDVLRSLMPSPSGNGRALAFDPHAGHLFYTNSGDPHIYVTDTSGTPIMTLSPSVSGGPLINYGALTWQPTPTGGVLWGGRYDGSGSVDQINSSTGSVTPAFSFPLPAGDSCYNQPSGSIDGLAFDASDTTLWLGDDAARTLYHVRMDGSQIGSSFATPGRLCRSGIAVADNFLWLGLLSGPDQPPYEIGRVSKTDPSTLLQSISIPTGGGPEGLAVDHSTFSGKCVLWTSQFGVRTTLQARELPEGLCHDVPTYEPLPKPTLRSVGLLTFHTFDKDNKPIVFGCVATVVNSQNLSTIITAAHCVIDHSPKDGKNTPKITNLQFAPAHTGGCWQGNPLSTPQIDVDQCGGNPYGVWYADPKDVFFSQKYVSAGKPDDFAFIVLKLRGPQLPVQRVVGGFPITWDTSTNPSTDPLQQQTWRISSYAADDPNFTIHKGFGPFECDWNASTSPKIGSSPRLLGALLGNACSFVNPITGSERAFNFPSCKEDTPDKDPCLLVPPYGASGSPWTNAKNTGDGTISIGAVLSSSYNNCDPSSGVCLETYQGTKLGDEAQAIFATAQEQQDR